MTQKFPVGQAGDISAGGMKVFQVNGKSILVAHAGGGFYAVENRCPHLGLPLSGGKLEGANIVCPFHGSRFDLHTGENMDWVLGIGGVKLPDWSRKLLMMGKKPAPVNIFRVSVEDNQLFVEME
jgi:nitrite reductase/ring-hydroxylating ferredoxin subunit